MTSAEKVAELRARLLEEVAVDPTLQTLWGIWRFVGPFARKPLSRVFEGIDLEDAEQLDELLGMIAGVALALRSDGQKFEMPMIEALRRDGETLLERVCFSAINSPRVR